MLGEQSAWAPSDEGTEYTPRSGSWTTVMFGEERVHGSGSTVLKNNRVLSQGRSCMKYFRLLYKLEELVPQPWRERLTDEEKREKRNTARVNRRRRQRERELREAE